MRNSERGGRGRGGQEGERGGRTGRGVGRESVGSTFFSMAKCTY